MEWLGGILLGALIGYLLEFTRPWVVALFTQGSLSLREQRRASLLREYRRIKRYKNDSSLAIRFMLRHVFALAGFAFIAIMTVGSTLIRELYSPSKNISLELLSWNIFYVFLYASVFYVSFSFVSFSRRLNRFRKYKEKTLAKYRKLGGNPEDLDKEEAEGG